MFKISIGILLLFPFWGVVYAKSRVVTGDYATIAGELLKNRKEVNKKIAVAEFSYSDGRDSRDGEVVSERITTELVKSKNTRVVERKEKEKIFEELKFQNSGAIESGSIKKIGEMLGADWVVVGTLTELPYDRVELNLRMVDVASGEVLSAYSGVIAKDWLDYYRKLLEKAEVETLAAENTKDAAKFYEKGRLSSDLNDYNKAIANFSIALNINPIYWLAYMSRGFAYSNNKEYGKAIKDYTKVIETTDKTMVHVFGYLYMARAEAFALTGDFANALADSDSAVQISPQTHLVYHNRGAIYILKGEYDRAIEDFDKALAIELSGDSFYARGLSYYNRKNQLIDNTISAIQYNPAKTEGYLQDLRSTCELPSFTTPKSEEGEFVAKAIKEDPAIIKRWLSVFVKCEKYIDLAFKDFNSALSFMPPNYMWYIMRGTVYFERHEYDLAISDLNAGSQIAPKEVLGTIHEGLAEAYIMRGNFRLGSFRNQGEKFTPGNSKNTSYLDA
ncbi:MAG: FlgO family outer membrane protein [Elusimicrobiota bacterium]